MSPGKKDLDDIQESPTVESEPVTIREVWRDVRTLNKDVRRLLNILLGDGDEKDGLVNEVKSHRKRLDFIEKIIFGAIAVVLLAVLTAMLAYIIRQPHGEKSDLGQPQASLMYAWSNR